MNLQFTKRNQALFVISLSVVGLLAVVFGLQFYLNNLNALLLPTPLNLQDKPPCADPDKPIACDDFINLEAGSKFTNYNGWVAASNLNSTWIASDDKDDDLSRLALPNGPILSRSSVQGRVVRTVRQTNNNAVFYNSRLVFAGTNGSGNVKEQMITGAYVGGLSKIDTNPWLLTRLTSPKPDAGGYFAYFEKPVVANGNSDYLKIGKMTDGGRYKFKILAAIKLPARTFAGADSGKAQDMHAFEFSAVTQPDKSVKLEVRYGYNNAPGSNSYNYGTLELVGSAIDKDNPYLSGYAGVAADKGQLALMGLSVYNHGHVDKKPLFVSQVAASDNGSAGNPIDFRISFSNTSNMNGGSLSDGYLDANTLCGYTVVYGKAKDALTKKISMQWSPPDTIGGSLPYEKFPTRFLANAALGQTFPILHPAPSFIQDKPGSGHYSFSYYDEPYLVQPSITTDYDPKYLNASVPRPTLLDFLAPSGKFYLQVDSLKCYQFKDKVEVGQPSTLISSQTNLTPVLEIDAAKLVADKYGFLYSHHLYPAE